MSVEIVQQPSNGADTNGRRRRIVEIRKSTAVLVRDRRGARDHMLGVFRPTEPRHE